MTATAHAIVGGAIAASGIHPALGITLSCISHPLLDMVPHWDLGWGWRQKSKVRLFTEATCDVLVGFAISYALFGAGVNFWYFCACIIASISWDLMEVPYWFLKWSFFPFGAIYKFQSGIQGKAKTAAFGIGTQIATIAITITLSRLFN